MSNEDRLVRAAKALNALTDDVCRALRDIERKLEGAGIEVEVQGVKPHVGYRRSGESWAVTLDGKPWHQVGRLAKIRGARLIPALMEAMADEAEAQLRAVEDKP